MTSAPVRIVLVDDHPIVREGLRAMLSREVDMEVVATVPTAEDGLRVITALTPDIAVVDYRLPGMSGIQLCEVLKARHPEVSVIMLTSYLADVVVRGAIEAGARAFVYKDVDAVELKRSIRAVARGEAALHGAVTERVIGWALKASRGLVGQALSAREVEVLRLVAAGASNKEVANQLAVTVNTVKTYLTRTLQKLDCHSRAEAAAAAAKLGLL